MRIEKEAKERFKEVFEAVSKNGNIAWYHADGNGRELFVTKGKQSFRLFWIHEKECIEIAKTIQLRAIAIILADMEAGNFEEVDIKKEAGKYKFKSL